MWYENTIFSQHYHPSRFLVFYLLADIILRWMLCKNQNHTLHKWVFCSLWTLHLEFLFKIVCIIFCSLKNQDQALLSDRQHLIYRYLKGIYNIIECTSTIHSLSCIRTLFVLCNHNHMIWILQKKRLIF